MKEGYVKIYTIVDAEDGSPWDSVFTEEEAAEVKKQIEEEQGVKCYIDSCEVPAFKLDDPHHYTYSIEVEEELFPEVGEFEPTTFTIRRNGKGFSMSRAEYAKFIEILRNFVWDYDNNDMHWEHEEDEGVGWFGEP